jgi:putative ABC transport system ATP-binding protein
MSNIISINNLLFKWPSQNEYLLEIENFTINKGEALFLNGASGSGKSSLLSLLGGITIPQKGSISILDTDITKLSAGQRDQFRADHMGIIFQQFNLVPYLSILDNVTLPCRFSNSRFKSTSLNSKTPEEEAQRLLNTLELNTENLTRKKVGELSVGQQQRVAAARALIGAPDIIIADEPTSSLDADTQERFLELLFQQCKSQNTTLFFVSHDNRFAKLFDKTININSLSTQKAENIVEGGAL